MPASAESLYLRGIDLTNRGRYAAATRALDAAAAKTDDENLLARITGTRSYVEVHVGDPELAERLCLGALASDALSVETRAILFGQLGAISLHRGRLEDAAEWLGRSIAGLSHDPPRAADMRMNRSMVFMRLGRLAEATADLEAAMEVYEAEGLDEVVAQVQHNLGYVAMLAGDLVGALQAMQGARALLENASPVWTAIEDVDRAEVLRDAGLTTEAERILERVARVFGAHRMRQARAEAELNLARSLLSHDAARAARIAGAAARRFASLGSESWAARAEGVRLRAVLSTGGFDRTGNALERARALPDSETVEEAASALDTHGFRGDAAALRLSMQLSLTRRRRAEVSTTVVRLPPGAPLEVRLLAHEVRSARARVQGRERDVRRHAALGIAVLESSQRAFGSLDLQASIGMQGNGLMLAGLASAMRTRRPDVLFEWSERARHLSQQVVPLRPPPDPALAAELAELRVLRLENPSSDWLADPRAAALQDRARERQWSGTGAAAVQERIGLDAARATLAGEDALISYVFDGVSIAAVVVTPSSTRVVDVDWSTVRRVLVGLRADLDVSAAVQSGPMARIVRAALDDRLATLSAALLEPVTVAASDARRLVITVPGVLSGVPWAMLPAMRGRAFTLAPSASRWYGARTDASRHRPAEAPDSATPGPTNPGLGDPGPPTPSSAETLHAGFAVGPRVPRGDEEVEVAASAWPSWRTLRGRDATVDAVTELASTVDVLHVASHGRHTADNPLFSGLELVDGTLFGYDIDRMPRVPATVVLSACEVGRSSVMWGEEAIGMTRTWLHAGSRVVVAAPVIVADDVACELLGAMHEGLAAGMAPALALAQASERTGLVAPFQCHGSGF